MGIADDLLLLADRLSAPGESDPEQAFLRRSVSTLYYALFHLLVGEAVLGWSGSDSARLALQRTYEHRRMREVSVAVTSGSWRSWCDPPISAPANLKFVASTFVRLQTARQTADYDNSRHWTRAEVSDLLDEARRAFASWAAVRSDPSAGEYLLSLLVGKKRD